MPIPPMCIRYHLFANSSILLEYSLHTITSVFPSVTIPIYICAYCNFFHLKKKPYISYFSAPPRRKIPQKSCLVMLSKSSANLFSYTYQALAPTTPHQCSYLVPFAKLNHKFLALTLFNIYTEKCNRAQMVVNSDTAKIASNMVSWQKFGPVDHHNGELAL